MRALLPSTVKQNITNALGWKTHRKIVVFESDDWGSTRMPSRGAYASAVSEGLGLDELYDRCDALESSCDLSGLFEVLAKHRDSQGRAPIITANFLMANPDFEKVAASGYREYHYELFTESYSRQPGCELSFRTLQEGMAEALIRPQLHGREHLNVPLWLSALQEGSEDTLLAFQYGLWCHRTDYRRARTGYFLVALDYDTPEAAKAVTQGAEEAANLFEKVFGFRSRTFIAPCYVWGPSLESLLASLGVEALQGQRNQLIPVGRAMRYRKRFHYTGQRNGQGQTYLVRNAIFEPFADRSRDWVETCLKEISSAFGWRTPAIVSCHRVNFMGSLVPENRETGLQALDRLLGAITRRWPEVEFLSSDRLAACIGGEAAR